MTKVITIGLSGVTCGGKSTVAFELKKLFPNSQIFCQDHYFYEENDPRHVWCEDVDHINYDILESIDMEKMHQDLLSAIGIRTFYEKNANPTTSHNKNTQQDVIQNIHRILDEQQVKIIILDGFLLFNYEPFINLISHKYFFTLTQEECVERRDKRVYDPPDVPGYFEKCVWPMYLKHWKEVEDSVPDVIYFDNQSKDVMDVVLNNLYHTLL